MSTINWVVFVLILLGALSLFLILRNYAKRAAFRKPETDKSLDDFSFETSEALAPQTPLVLQRPPNHWPAGELTFTTSILAVVSRSPWSLYVYWEFVPQENKPLQKLVDFYGAGAYPILRIYELTEFYFAKHTIKNYFDLTIPADAYNWYVEVPHPAAIYCVELGIVLPGISYINLLRSREVATPRNNMSPRIDPDWLPLQGLQFGFGSPSESFSSATMVNHKLIIREDE